MSSQSQFFILNALGNCYILTPEAQMAAVKSILGIQKLLVKVNELTPFHGN